MKEPKFFLDDDTPAVKEPLPADVQQALDNMLDHGGEPPELLPMVDRVDSKALVFPGDPRCMYEHALDLAPVGSKIVRLAEGAVIATPDGAVFLTPFDPANQLPRDAKVVKLGEGAVRLSMLAQDSSNVQFEGASTIAVIADAIDSLHG